MCVAERVSLTALIYLLAFAVLGNLRRRQFKRAALGTTFEVADSQRFACIVVAFVLPFSVVTPCLKLGDPGVRAFLRAFESHYRILALQPKLRGGKSQVFGGCIKLFGDRSFILFELLDGVIIIRTY